MYKCKLATVSRPDVDGGLRTKEVEGYTPEKPEVGKSFVMFSEPIEKLANLRFIETSPIVSLSESVARKGKKSILFKTKTGSVYKVEISCRKTKAKK